MPIYLTLINFHIANLHLHEKIELSCVKTSKTEGKLN